MNLINHSIILKTLLVISQGKLSICIKGKIVIIGFSSENKPARSHLNVLVAHNDDPTNTLVIRFCDQEKIGVKDVKEYCRKMEEENITSTILVVRKGLSPMARDVNYLLKFFREKKRFLF
jgi:hypothetical protein